MAIQPSRDARRRCATALLAAFLAAFNAAPQAVEPVRACGPDWPPFTAKVDGGRLEGLSVELNAAALRRGGRELVAEFIPWKRCLDLVARGNYMAAFDKTRIEPYLFGEHPTGFYPLVMFVRDDFPDTSFSFEAFAGKVMGAVRGYDYSARVRSYEGWVRRDYGSDEKLIRALAAGRVDYALSDLYSAPLLSKSLGVEIRALEPPVDSAPLYLGFAPGQAALRDLHSEGLAAMIADGTLDRLYTEYLGYSYADAVERFAPKR